MVDSGYVERVAAVSEQRGSAGGTGSAWVTAGRCAFSGPGWIAFDRAFGNPHDMKGGIGDYRIVFERPCQKS